MVGARRRLVHGAVVAVILTAGCATRLPVVTEPAYPQSLFPTVPADYAGSAAARGHEEAWTYFQAGDLATAEARYASVLDDTPSFYPAAAGLGWLSLARGDDDAAVAHFERATADAPTYLSALVGHGEALLGLSRPVDALRSFEAALEEDPGLTDVRRMVEELRFTIVSDRLATARDAASAGRFAEATAAYDEVIASSPDSAFLHVEIGRVEQQRGDLAAALVHAQRASEIDMFTADAWLLEGELHEARGDLDAALTAYERAESAGASEETARNVDRIYELMRVAELPPEVGEIPSTSEVTRGDLAVLIGVRLPDLLADAAGRRVIITDTRDHWGSQWIQSVADAGLMDVRAASRFEPAGSVRRSDLADVVAAVMDLIEEATASGPLAPPGSLRFTDMQANHLSFASATRAVAAGMIDLLDNDTFQPSRVVTGAEAVDVVARLAELARDAQ